MCSCGFFGAKTEQGGIKGQCHTELLPRNQRIATH